MIGPNPTRTRALVAGGLAAVAFAACRTASPAAAASATGTVAGQANVAALAQARADSARTRYAEADVRFMTDMIGHHAQAITMAQWAPSHGASPSVQTLAARIINAQKDEIATMQRWLADRHLPVPPARPMTMKMDGMNGEHAMLMPGMLTDAQMQALDSARGEDFDRLFLTDMIQHHRGAVTMVRQWLDSYGVGQDETVFKLATDVNADQTTEIARMQRMLLALATDGDSP